MILQTWEVDGVEEGTIRRAEVGLPLLYEPSPKHKPVPTPGRHGSICPRGADGPGLLKDSDLVGNKRYATNGVDAYCAHQHRPNAWHGFPVGWDEVPPQLVGRWVTEGKVDRRTIRRAKRQRER